MKTKINYPTWKVKGTPTPNDKLMVCDVCGCASWMPRGPLTNVQYHSCSGKQRRLREAKPEEYKSGKAALKTII